MGVKLLKDISKFWYIYIYIYLCQVVSNNYIKRDKTVTNSSGSIPFARQSDFIEKQTSLKFYFFEKG